MFQSKKPIILASHNAHKVSEFQLAFRDLQLQITPPPYPFEVSEDAPTFKENALKKALSHAQHWRVPAIGDDSGLEVDALQGAPGVFSARFAGKSGSEATPANNALLLKKLQNFTPAERTAHFTCALCLVVVDSTHIAAFSELNHPDMIITSTYAALTVEGYAFGHILTQPAGIAGFGYDPLFMSEDLQKTFAEASSEEKLSVSHRGRAIEKMIKILEKMNS